MVKNSIKWKIHIAPRYIPSCGLAQDPAKTLSNVCEARARELPPTAPRTAAIRATAKTVLGIDPRGSY